MIDKKNEKYFEIFDLLIAEYLRQKIHLPSSSLSKSLCKPKSLF